MHKGYLRKTYKLHIRCLLIALLLPSVSGKMLPASNSVGENMKLLSPQKWRIGRLVFTGCYPASEAPALAASPTVQSIKFLVAGAIGGVISRTIVSPLEVVATINMVSTIADKSVLEELTKLWSDEGITGFFKGNGVNCLKVAPTKGIQFLCFEFLKRFILRIKSYLRKPLELDSLDRLVAGGFAGVIAATFVYPLETIKSVLTVERARYGPSIIIAGKKIYKEHGISALYRGLLPTVIAMMPYVGSEFCAYETLKHFCLANFNRRPDRTHLTTTETLLIGAVAGAIAQCTCHPLDVVRKRLQVQGLGERPVQYYNMLDGLAGIATSEGISALYKGLSPACLATVPSTGSSYVVYEFVKRLLGIASK